MLGKGPGRMTLRFRDLLLAPALLSWLRVPLAACFPLVLQRPATAVAVLFAAGLSDVLDGWVARRYGLVTPAGTVLDPVTDKLFVLVVAGALLVDGRLSPAMILLLGTREFGELPLVAWYGLRSKARLAREATPAANFSGKLVTCLQFGTVTWALLRLPRLELWVFAAAGAGALAAIGYWTRAIRAARSAPARTTAAKSMT